MSEAELSAKQCSSAGGVHVSSCEVIREDGRTPVGRVVDTRADDLLDEVLSGGERGEQDGEQEMRRD